jgi:sRNA-binding protein
MLALEFKKAIVAKLAKRWPNCFYLAGHERRPLKVGIGREIDADRLGITASELGLVLNYYVGSHGYLDSMRAGADRISLDGKLAGVVTEADEAHAKAKIAAREAACAHAVGATQGLKADYRGPVGAARSCIIDAPNRSGASAGREL